MATGNLSVNRGGPVPSAQGMYFGIVVAEWNREITEALLGGAVATLKGKGSLKENFEMVRVPGSFELPVQDNG